MDYSPAAGYRSLPVMISVFSCAAGPLIRPLRDSAVFSFILSLAMFMFLSSGSASAFDPYSPDPLSLDTATASTLEPDEIPVPALTLVVLGEKKPAEPAPRVATAATAVTEPQTADTDEASGIEPDITRGPRRAMEVSVTFDGGGYESPEEAESILATLKRRSIKATIFLTGLFIRKYPALVREMVRDGHEIGNHTLAHPHLTDFNRTLRQDTLEGVDGRFVERQLRGAAELFKTVTGTEMSHLWRAPYGESNHEIRRWAFESGYVHVGWTYDAKNRQSLDTLDWVHDRNSRLYRTSSEIKARVLDFGKDSGGISGGIILMHLGTLRKDDRASDVLGEMLDALSARGYRFVKVSEQLRGTGLLHAAAKKRKPALGGLVRLDEAQERPASLRR